MRATRTPGAAIGYDGPPSGLLMPAIEGQPQVALRNAPLPLLMRNSESADNCPKRIDSRSENNF